MGRLTLNILLSFAQFEREIISERTRDRMSAARRRGKWVGGLPVLGYDVAPGGGRLIVNAEEAARVRAIYHLYLDHKALIPVVREIDRRGWLTKRWITRKGIEQGGRPFTKNSLHRLLTNVACAGKVRYKGVLYEGEHDALVDAGLWQRVQDALRTNARTGGREVRNKYGALLKGLLSCTPCGTGMAHTCTGRNGKRYRYYGCRNARQRGRSSCPGRSLNAHRIETAVVEHVRGIGMNQQAVAATVAKAREQRLTALREEAPALEREAVDESDLARALEVFDPVWTALAPREQARSLRLLIERVGYDGRDGTVTVTFRPPGIEALCRKAGLNGLEVMR
jgi:site-specific DNA recombinase